jgi:hypothetical protein
MSDLQGTSNPQRKEQLGAADSGFVRNSLVRPRAESSLETASPGRAGHAWSAEPARGNNGWLLFKPAEFLAR